MQNDNCARMRARKHTHTHTHKQFISYNNIYISKDYVFLLKQISKRYGNRLDKKINNSKIFHLP